MNQYTLAPFEFGKFFYSDRFIPDSFASVRSPNPAPLTPQVSAAAYAAGPRPGISALKWWPLLVRTVSAPLLVILAWSFAVGTRGEFSVFLYLLITIVFGLLCLGGAAYLAHSVWRTVVGAFRVDCATRHGWVDYYPALISEIWVVGVINHEHDPTEYEYMAKARIQLPNGSTEEVNTEVFCSEIDSDGFKRMGIVVVNREEEAQFTRPNGWYLAAHLATEPVSEASFRHGLTVAQVKAGLDAV